MKLKYATLAISLVLLIGLESCKKELETINRNPNATENAQPDYLLTAATKNVVDYYWGISRSSNPASLFVQHWSMIQCTDPDRYIFTNNDFQGLWKTGYSGIVNLNEIIALAEKSKNTNYQGVALVLRSWVFALLTDHFGDIPYSQSIQIDEYITPEYDSQREVYLGLLADLERAQSLLTTTGKPIAGDILYKNNIGLWKKFANSLRLRIALRIADREPGLAKEVLTTIQSEGGSFIESNNETARLVYSNSPNQNPISNYFDTRDDYRVSKTIVDRLKELNDPRLPVYASKTKDPTPEIYVGLPNGLLVGDASNYGFSKTSVPGAYFLAPQSPAVILSYAEVLFGRAEAAARGFTTEDPAALYRQAVRASLQQFGIAEEDIDGYLSQATVQYDASNYRKSIGDQKWIALFGQGPEAFAEWRRLDYPELIPAAAGVLNGQIPSRFIYPGIEQSLNGANYKKAVSGQGADVLTTKLWFDIH